MGAAVLASLWVTGVLTGKAEVNATFVGVLTPVAAILVGLIVSAIAYGISGKSNRVFNITLVVCMLAFFGFLGWISVRRAENVERGRQLVAEGQKAVEASKRASRRFADDMIAGAKKYRADADAFAAAGGVRPATLTEDAEIASRLTLAKAMQGSNRNNCAIITSAEAKYLQVLRQEGCPDEHLGRLVAEFRGELGDLGDAVKDCEFRTQTADATVAYLEFLHARAGKFSFSDGSYEFEEDADVEEFERLRKAMVAAAKAEAEHFRGRKSSGPRR